ncbi:hypothetical protein WQ56_12425 [Luteimonas sp. FCS-9]|nr:hypothetical protein WQ56_12425 [Luteimonas sp. FCS-9]
MESWTPRGPTFWRPHEARMSGPERAPPIGGSSCARTVVAAPEAQSATASRNDGEGRDDGTGTAAP